MSSKFTRGGRGSSGNGRVGNHSQNGAESSQKDTEITTNKLERRVSRTSLLLGTIMTTVETHAVNLATDMPSKSGTIINMLELANTEHFRNKVPVLADQISARGAWAYPGGQPKGSQAWDDSVVDIRDFHKTNKTGMRMRRFYPDIVGFELIEHGFVRVFSDIRESGSDCIYIDMSSPIKLIERFQRKMEDRVKTLARKEAKLDYDPYYSEHVEHLAIENLSAEYNVGQVIQLQPDKEVEQRILVSQICSLLSHKPIHEETIKHQFELGYTPKEAAEVCGVSPETIKRRRDAVMRYLRRKMK